MLFVRSLSPEEEKELDQRMRSAKKTRIFVRLSNFYIVFVNLFSLPRVCMMV